MANIAEGIKDLLVAAGIGTFASTTGWSIFIAKEPRSPDNVVTVYNTGGLAPNPKFLLDFPSVQIRVRGLKGDYEAAYSKIVDVKNALLGIDSQDVNGDRLVAANLSGDINSIGFDDNNRPLLTLNFRLIVEPATGTNRVPL